MKNKIILFLICTMLLASLNYSLISSISTNTTLFENALRSRTNTLSNPQYNIFQDYTNLSNLNTNYITHAAISINSNSNFLSQNITEKWSGAGTASDPILIEDYFISQNQTNQISISNTDLYIDIKNNFLDGQTVVQYQSYSGIILSNVTNIVIEGNFVNNSNYGIQLNDYSYKNTIQNNTINNADYGISVLFASHFNLIFNNTITNTNNYAVWVSSNIQIPSPANNTFTDNNIIKSGTGFSLYSVNDSIFENNRIEKTNIAFNLYAVSNNSFFENQLINNFQGFNAHSLFGTNYSVLNNFTENKIVNINTYAFQFSVNATNNLVIHNDIASNGLSIYHAFDNGTGNTFKYNYWDGRDITDLNNDGYTDSPYVISGASHNTDSFSLAKPYSWNVHYLTTPDLLNLVGGETINTGSIIISWVGSTDTNNHIVQYSLYYSSNGASSWNQISLGISQTTYNWNTYLLSNGTSYFIKIVAQCDHGLLVSNQSAFSFSIINIKTAPTTTPTTTPTTSPTTTSTSSSQESTTSSTTINISAPGFEIFPVFLSLFTIIAIAKRRRK